MTMTSTATFISAVPQAAPSTTKPALACKTPSGALSSAQTSWAWCLMRRLVSAFTLMSAHWLLAIAVCTLTRKLASAFGSMMSARSLSASTTKPTTGRLVPAPATVSAQRTTSRTHTHALACPAATLNASGHQSQTMSTALALMFAETSPATVISSILTTTPALASTPAHWRKKAPEQANGGK